MRSYLDFEKPVAELEAKVEELRALQSGGDSIAIGDEISRIEGKAAIALKELYGALTPWQKTQVARHPQRPHCIDYVAALITDFVPLAGDRKHGAEERGQAEAIARCTETCLEIGVPNIAVIIGEGGSGGAIAIATANRVLMLEHAIYSVISPEGAASILWRDTAKAEDAASNMKITAQDLARFGIIDMIVPEPTGGAHRDPAAAINVAGEAVSEALGELRGLDRATVTRLRREKFAAIGRTLG